MNIMQLDVVRAVHLEDIACITSEKKARTIQTRLSTYLLASVSQGVLARKLLPVAIIRMEECFVIFHCRRELTVAFFSVDWIATLVSE
jgi:hypothetical protein